MVGGKQYVVIAAGGGKDPKHASGGVYVAFALPAGSADAAMVVTLPPGAYTAQVGGANNSTGIALVEIYEVP